MSAASNNRPKNNHAKHEGKGVVIQETLTGIEPAPNCTPVIVKRMAKKWRVLMAFLDGSQLHRFTAFKLNDTCLHSTISELRHRDGIEFDDKDIIVKSPWGFPTPVTLYWLKSNADNMEKASGRVMSKLSKLAA
jgi:hypothetical protein